MARSCELRQRAPCGRPLLAVAVATLALLAVLRAAGSAFALLASRTQPAPRGARARVSLRATITTEDTELEETEVIKGPPKRKKGGKLPSQLTGLSAEEIEARKEKALDIWDSLKVDVKDEIDRYQTFRMDKFEKFMRADSRGLKLFELYQPGTPEYAEFFEEVMGPFIFELAQDKLKEGLGQALGVIAVVGTIATIGGYFGTDIINAITSPFQGFASQFVELYGF
mmetsp:Transcript_59666/g.134439  ORF Transcript_59666/g.134439 Transcript_59666/m.134439 type:complete len:226 (+) Transcript_59666:50-727(+)